MATTTSLETSGRVKSRMPTSGPGSKLSGRPLAESQTDRTRWRIRDDESNHTWHYLEDDEAAKEWPQSTAEKYFLGLPLVYSPPAVHSTIGESDMPN